LAQARRDLDSRINALRSRKLALDGYLPVNAHA
jgi:hypothetical protein